MSEPASSDWIMIEHGRCLVCGQQIRLTVRQERWLRERVEGRGGVYYPPIRCLECQARRTIAQRSDLRLASCCECGEPFACLRSLQDPVKCRCCWEMSKERGRGGVGGPC